jgi:hypothetical protein
MSRRNKIMAKYNDTKLNMFLESVENYNEETMLLEDFIGYITNNLDKIKPIISKKLGGAKINKDTLFKYLNKKFINNKDTLKGELDKIYSAVTTNSDKSLINAGSYENELTEAGISLLGALKGALSGIATIPVIILLFIMGGGSLLTKIVGSEYSNKIDKIAEKLVEKTGAGL